MSIAWGVLDKTMEKNEKKVPPYHDLDRQPALAFPVSP